MRDLNANFTEEKNKLQSSALIHLYEFDLSGSPYRIAEYDETVTFGGVDYAPFPIQRTEMQEDNQGQVNEFSLLVANPSRVFGGYLELYNGLIGTKVTMITVFRDHLNDANAKIEEEFYIKRTMATDKVVTVILAPKYDLSSFVIPRRTYERNFCQWTYKNTGCYLYEETTGGYTAPPSFNSTENCDHSLDGPSGCEFHTNEGRFGGFFGIPQKGYIIRI